jgi:hypothetical protein
MPLPAPLVRVESRSGMSPRTADARVLQMTGASRVIWEPAAFRLKEIVCAYHTGQSRSGLTLRPGQIAMAYDCPLTIKKAKKAAVIIKMSLDIGFASISPSSLGSAFEVRIDSEHDLFRTLSPRAYHAPLSPTAPRAGRPC